MPTSQRQHIRFSLNVPAVRYTKFGEKQETVLHQISVGGCLAEWEDNISTGEEFRLEIQLPNKNWLPLKCKVVYQFEHNGLGIKFSDVTRFEQELIARTIVDLLEKENLPVVADPFAQPPRAFRTESLKLTDPDAEKERLLGQAMSSENNPLA